MRTTVLAAVTGLTLSLGLVATASSANAAPGRTFKNCTALNKTYAHGVGRPGARDKTSGSPVKNFKVDKATYNANARSDRDKDGIACEKK